MSDQQITLLPDAPVKEFVGEYHPEHYLLKEDLTKILDYIDTLNQLDTDNVEPMSHPFPYTNNFREDEAKASEDRELILKNAPQQKDGCFKVPTTVE